MPKKKRAPRDVLPANAKHFATLRPYLNKLTIGRVKRKSMYLFCVRASLGKCFEFNELVYDKRKAKDAFFWLSSLRGICEDLIVLNFIKGLPPKDRNELIHLLMQHDLLDRIAVQKAFFSKFRPVQPILSGSGSSATLDALQTRIRSIWKRHGWPNLERGIMPQTRQLAERQSVDVLSSMYDFLFRLTSASVHFNVQALLRSGWGPLESHFHFSTKNFYPYYLAFARTYGAFLFCIYFEFFSHQLRAGKRVLKLVAQIRKELLLQQRWPEMVTFEELNMEPPKPNFLMQIVMGMMQAEKNRLVPSP